MRRDAVIYAGLLVLTLVLFWPVRSHDFINYDDNEYVTENPNVKSGITIENVRWAFARAHSGNWHPLTWISHMLDVEFFGLSAGKHHLVNVWFHALNTLLLFLLLKQMTGTVWRSAFVAALFAWHPMHVQSVAWIAERKDVLSGFFALLTLLAYTYYARCPTAIRYLVMAILFALGLMAKPMLVTLPFVLLLVDFWPLKRWKPLTDEEKSILFLRPAVGNLRPLLLEKVPLLLMVLASCIVTLWAQRKADFVVDSDSLAWHWRAVNALVFYTAYLPKLFWPTKLAIFYPFPQMHSWEIVLAALLPVALTFVFLRLAPRRPYLLIGWLLFLGMLVPVIGLVQVGMQSIADRYTYLPAIGLFIMVAFGLGDLASKSAAWRAAVITVAIAITAACAGLTRAEVLHWKDSVTIFSRAVTVTGGKNFISYFMLGNGWREQGDLPRAAAAYRSALQINSNLEAARLNLGYTLLRQEKFAESELELRRVLIANPENLRARQYLANSLAVQHRTAEATAEYSILLKAQPDHAHTREILASLLVQQGEIEKALECVKEGLRIHRTPNWWSMAGTLLTMKRSFPEAITHYEEALKLRPDAPDVLNNIAWIQATCEDAAARNGAAAVKHAERACVLTAYKQPTHIGTLAAAYAEAGRFSEAVAMAEKAGLLARETGDESLAQRNHELMQQYLRRQPHRETFPP